MGWKQFASSVREAPDQMRKMANAMMGVIVLAIVSLMLSMVALVGVRNAH